jgi:TrmH family RNA methyltransferase
MNGRHDSLKPLKWYEKLATGKGRQEASVFLLEGDRAIGQIAKSHPEAIVEVVAAGESLPAYKDYPVRYVTERQFKKICLTKTPQGLLAVVRLPDNVNSASLPDDIGDRILLLEDIQDPGNVGSLIRSAVAFGYSGVVMSDKCADPFSPKCVQATAGTVLSLWIRRSAAYMNAVGELKKRGYKLVATAISGSDRPSVLAGLDKVVLALGNEASGLSDTVVGVSDYCCKIPISSESAESLNVAACGAICMYINVERS